ncbi:MAG: ParB/RepB/Spo0J family partition protein, partial [Thermomicrobiaceae bacterium]
MSSGRGKGRRKFTVDSLFQDTSPRAAGVRDLVDAKVIDIDRIVPDPDQPRQTFDEDALDELTSSIRQEGLLQPIAVRYDDAGDQYVILHGERRWRAAKQAGVSAVPAIVRDVPEERRLIHQLMENVVREDLNAVDRAAALRLLKRQMDDAPWERVAETVGIRRSRLFQLLSTEKLVASVQDRIRAGVLSEKQTRSLQGLAPDAQENLAEMLVDGLSEKQAQSISRRLRDNTEYLNLDSRELQDHITSIHQEVRDPESIDTGPSGAVDPLAQSLSQVAASDASDLQQSIERLGIQLGQVAAGDTYLNATSTQLRALKRL